MELNILTQLNQQVLILTQLNLLNMADKKISELTLSTPNDDDVIPFTDVGEGVTYKALKSALKGDAGTAATATAGTTTTLAAGESATVTNVGTTSAAIFNFAIPQGIQGLTGDDGDDGAAATIAVGTVTTVANNVPASVTNVGTSAAAIFDFEIPKGLDGAGSGDVTGPATNTDSYIPQWDGANSKTLKNGLGLDTDLSSVSASDDTIPSAKATKAMGDLKLPLAGGTMTGDIQLGETDIKLDATLSGDEKWSGIVIAGTAGATLAVGDVCYLASSGKWLLNDGILDGTDTGFSKQLGICVLAGNDTEPTEMLVYGKVRSAAFPAFTVGSPVYLSDTAGDLVVTQPSTANFAIRIVGYAITAEDLFFNPSNDYIIHS
jgi:hypothetical protein